MTRELVEPDKIILLLDNFMLDLVLMSFRYDSTTFGLLLLETIFVGISFFLIRFWTQSYHVSLFGPIMSFMMHYLRKVDCMFSQHVWMSITMIRNQNQEMLNYLIE